MAAIDRILSPSSLLLLFFFFFFFSTSAASAPTVYEILTEYGLPQGLLPDGVKEYSLSSDGDFVVELFNPCYVRLTGLHFTDLAYYEKTITGKLEHGRISNIYGIQFRKYLAWFAVGGIIASPSDNSVEFTVGFLSEKHPVSSFAQIPSCRSKAVTSSRGAESLISEV